MTGPRTHVMLFTCHAEKVSNLNLIMYVELGLQEVPIFFSSVAKPFKLTLIILKHDILGVEGF